MLASGGRGRPIFVQRLTTRTDHQWARTFTDERRELHAKTAQSALTVILKLVITLLTSVILIVLSTVNIQFQGRFSSISLRLILRTVATYVMTTGLVIMQLTSSPGGGFSIYKTAHRICLRMYL